MRAHWSYLRYVLRHKWYVAMAGLRLRVSLWQLFVHDWTKFLPREWFPYVRTFYSPDGSSRYNETPAFAVAWNHHQKANPHHWQYWLITWDRGETEALPMPERFAREMVADWMGAGAAVGKPNTPEWYTKNRRNIQLHEDTRTFVEHLLLVTFNCDMGLSEVTR